jgi:hypothetical protein
MKKLLDETISSQNNSKIINLDLRHAEILIELEVINLKESSNL